MPYRPAALYFHIPFCKKKCDYCSFFSMSGASRETIHKTIEGTLEQARYFLLDNPMDADVSTIFLGGGTPGFLPAEELAYLLEGISRITERKHLEYSCEVNPESMDREKLRIMRELGVGRISMGIQSFKDKYLSYLGRLSSEKTVRNSLEMIKKYWTGQVSFDIITDLPGQSIEEAVYDVEEAVKYKPDHLSVYSLTVEEDTPLSARFSGNEAETDNYEMIVDFLNKNGYSRYEVSNFALSGKECRHNMFYWEMRPYAGFGPGAASTLPGPSGPVRIENPGEIKPFLEEERVTGKITPITPGEFLLEHFMMGLRLSKGLEIKKLENIFHIDIHDVFGDIFNSWTTSGLMENLTDKIVLNRHGLKILNPLLLQVLSRIEKVQVSEITWP